MGTGGEWLAFTTTGILGKSREKRRWKSESASPPVASPLCPECGSARVWKDGLRKTGNGDVQRYLCRSCGYRFSESRKTGNPLMGITAIPNTRQVCVTETQGAKNLAKVQPQLEKAGAGATSAEIKGKIIDYLWWMKKQGYKPTTIAARDYIMQNLLKRGANILDPESVKEVIAKVDTWSESRKSVVADTYTSFLRMLGLTWEKPRYTKTQRIPFIPTEKEIDELIANAGSKTGTALKVAKETAARIGEILGLKWVDLDEERRTLKFVAEKGSNPRILSVSSDLIAMLKALPRRNEYIFSSTHGHANRGDYSKQLMLTRKSLARKLQNPRLLEITYHTLRHWKGTMEYHKTKDIIHVKTLLGHKNINNTMIYINLERAIFKETNDEFTVRATSDIDEACKLMEVGFEYACDMDGKKLFRKRK